MSLALRVAGFAAGLVALFGAALGVGAATGASAPAGGDEDGGTHAAMRMDARADAASAPGLAVAADGLRLIASTTRLEAGRAATLRLRIADARGRTVRAFDVEHTKRLHLVLVRRDLQGFQHLHPTQAPDGSWAVRVTLTDAGAYRAYADFVPRGGTKTVLGTDLFVAGTFTPDALPAPAATARTGDYAVRLAGGGRPGAESRLTFTVTRAGRPVAPEPYLGADGHLVTLRAGDLAYLHTHPEADAGGPGRIAFATTYPSAGSYRLYLQFRHAGRVHTVAFTREVR